VDIFWVAATLIVVGFIVWAGVRMVTSKGDTTKFNEAKSALIKAIIGGLVIFAVGIIVNTLAAIGENPTRILR
jgi:tellurite resistance protein TehA-like permease